MTVEHTGPSPDETSTTPQDRWSEDVLIEETADALDAAAAVLQAGAGTAEQIVQFRGVARNLRAWVGHEPRGRADEVRRERAVALALALRR